MAPHGVTTTTLGSLDEAGKEDEIYNSTKKLLEEGLDPVTYVYHGGNTGGAEGEAIVSELFPFARGTSGSPGHNTRNPYDLASREVDDRDLSTLQGDVDETVNDGIAGFFNSHKIIEGTRADEGALEPSTQKLSDLADYVTANSEGWVRTEKVHRYLRNRKLGHSEGVQAVVSWNGNFRIEDSSGDSIAQFKEDSSFGNIANFHAGVVQYFGERVNFRGADIENIPEYEDAASAPDDVLFYNQNSGTVDYNPS